MKNRLMICRMMICRKSAIFYRDALLLLLLLFGFFPRFLSAQKLYLFCEGDYHNQATGNEVKTAVELVRGTIDQNMPSEFMVCYNGQNGDAGTSKSKWTGPDIGNSENVHDDILEAIERCPAGADDTIFFYWVGRGGQDENGLFLLMPEGKGVPTMYRAEILEALKRMNPRLVVFITDLSQISPEQSSVGPSETETHLSETGSQRYGRNQRFFITAGVPILYANLFFQYKGVLNLNSSGLNQKTMTYDGESAGTVFSYAVGYIFEEKRLEPYDWKTFVSQIDSSVRRRHHQKIFVWEWPKKLDTILSSDSAKPDKDHGDVGGRQAGTKKTLTVNGVDFTFRWCPPGEFTMGSPETEDGRFHNEAEHLVTLTHGFWLLESEVTQDMWESVMATNPSEEKGVGPQNPVYNVSWNDCQEFCHKLSALTGEKVTLPTEAQWEYACRAGSKGPYGGTGKPDEMGWYDYNSESKTHEVKGKKPNAWGLYDMHGNVGEWCSDEYGHYPSGSVTDPEGADSSSNRVERGGSWYEHAGRIRSALRGYRSPTVRSNTTGFRPAVIPSGISNSDEPEPAADAAVAAPKVIDPDSRAGEKKTITANGIDYTFCWCPPGEFTMGSPESEEGYQDEFEKQHRVRLTKGFWLLESEVTQEMWRSVMGTEKDRILCQECGKGDRYPVYSVNWEEAAEFCGKLSELSGEKIQLPTEAQWEYACRAGTKEAYGGTGNLDRMGWFKSNSDRTSHEVKGKEPNAWGLYDMHGNVQEWCSDWADAYETETAVDPTGPSDGSERILRGGSWDYLDWGCSSAYREARVPTARRDRLGFRPAMISSE